MRTTLALTTILYAIGLTGWLALQTHRPTARPALILAALGILELALILLAATDLLSLAAGSRPREMAVHVAYVGASVAVLPMVVAIGIAGRKEPGNTVASVGCAAVMIIVIRLQMTGGT